MSIFWKVFGDVCLYFSVLGAFPGIFSHDMTLLWPGLLCAAGVAIAGVLSDRGHGGVRFAGALLAAVSLVLADSAIEYVILAPAVIYSEALILRDETALEYYSFREYFRRALTAWAVFLVVIWAGSTFEETARPGASHALDSGAVMGYGALFCLSGVVLQRQLRLGENRTQARRMTGAQSAAMVILVAAVLLGVVALEYYLHDRATSVLNLLGEIIRWVFSAPIVLIAWLIGLMLNGVLKEANEALPSNGTEPTVTVTGTMPTGTGGEYTQPTVEVGYPWWFVVLVIGLMAVMLAYMLAVHRRRTKVSETKETARRIRDDPRTRQPSRRSPRAKVRRYYREFLKQERRRGLKLRKDQTSQDILQAASADPEAAAKLRDIYIRARYDEHAQITPEQVKAAKDALKDTKS